MAGLDIVPGVEGAGVGKRFQRFHDSLNRKAPCQTGGGSTSHSFLPGVKIPRLCYHWNDEFQP